jgi:hypothetical protein
VISDDRYSRNRSLVLTIMIYASNGKAVIGTAKGQRAGMGRNFYSKNFGQ